MRHQEYYLKVLLDVTRRGRREMEGGKIGASEVFEPLGQHQLSKQRHVCVNKR